MTAVSPQTFFPETVLDVEDGMSDRPVSQHFVNNNKKIFEGIVINNESVARCKMTIADGLRPLLASMKVFGMYFDRRAENAGDDPEKKSRRWSAYRIYAVAVVILLCLNSVRMLSVFTQGDTFGMILFMKLIIVIWNFQCFVSQAAFYAASHSGRLALVFDQLLEDSCAKHSRKFSTFLAVAAWSIIMSSLAFFVYGLLFSGGSQDMMLAPFQVHIFISNPLIARIVACLVSFYFTAAYIFSQAITFVLAMIFSYEFKKVDKALENCLVNHHRRVPESDIEKFRQKHQEIAMTVSHVDDCLMFSNAAAFCCQVSNLIILLYMILFYHSLITDPVFIVSYAFWLLILTFGLTLTAGSGIIVHHYVSKFVFIVFQS